MLTKLVILLHGQGCQQLTCVMHALVFWNRMRSDFDLTLSCFARTA